MSLLFNIFCILALEYSNAPKKDQANASIRTNDTKQRKKAGIEATTGAASVGGMGLPFQPHTLAFSHISYYEMKRHGNRGKRLQLSRDISGAFRPGVLTALMGMTGAVKTTLLAVLAGRKTGIDHTY